MDGGRRRQKIRLGCIADDFTGAGDLASFLAKGGLHTILYNGIPDNLESIEDADAVVLSLKSRTAPVSRAVSESLTAVKVLEKLGCTQFYIKYCSTFDSTPQGNIGPVVDAVMEYFGEPYTVLCPALPVNGRTVKDGILYVNGIPLEKSGMKNHPITPMWASRISELMKDQSKYPCIDFKTSRYFQMDETDKYKIIKGSEGKEHFYFVPDYYEEQHAEEIIRVFGGLKVLTGGSGIAIELARRIKTDEFKKAGERQEGNSRVLIVAGSVSQVTISQIKYYKKQGMRYYKIDPLRLWNGQVTAESIWNEEIKDCKGPILVYCSETEEDLKAGEMTGRLEFAELLEQILSKIAKYATDYGVRRIIVAGGETSGAVMKMLGYRQFKIGENIDPGVPIMIPVDQPDICVILKSGNFGKEDFFIRAIDMTEKREFGWTN